MVTIAVQINQPYSLLIVAMQAIVASSFIPVYAGFKDLPKIRGRVSLNNENQNSLCHTHTSLGIFMAMFVYGYMARRLPQQSHYTTSSHQLLRVGHIQPIFRRAHDQGSV